MATNYNDKQQILYESFDLFKDDWDNNVDTIRKTLEQMAKIDSNTAIQMWFYLLSKHPDKIKTDSRLTESIFRIMPIESYSGITENNLIIEALFKHSSDPWTSAGLITYYLEIPDYYTSNRLLELVSLNMNESEYSYFECKSSNLATMLYRILDRLRNLNNSDIEFFSTWIDHVEDNPDKIKLKVLMMSKEADEKRPEYLNHKNMKNDYLLENATLEDLELSSSNREYFEIKKIIEKICNYSIKEIDISRLDINWLLDVFSQNSGYSYDTFNLVGAYFLINSFSQETRETIRKIYKEKKSISSIVADPYSGDTELIIKQRMKLVMDKIEKYRPVWDFTVSLMTCDKILLLGQTFDEYIINMKKERAVELSQYSDVTVDSLKFNTRINNILHKHNILTLEQLIEFLDSGIDIEGLGYRSLESFRNRVNSYGIQLCSINDYINFVFNFLDIEFDANQSENVFYEINNKLGVPQGTFAWTRNRKEFKAMIDEQVRIAQLFINDFPVNCGNAAACMSLLRKDDNSIYMLGLNFFSTVNINNMRFSYKI